MQRQIQTVVAVALVSSAAILAARQSAVKPQSTGIPECDKYAAMVTACLPKMCEEERLLVELDLGFHHELLPAIVKLDGRQKAASVCAQSIDEAIKEDPYGCYAPKTVGSGAPVSIRLDSVRPTDTSVTMTFSGTGPAKGEKVRLVITKAISERPIAIYELPGWTGKLVLDTASATPVSEAKAAQTAPVRLEPRSTYCFVVQSRTDSRMEEHRKGIFTTLPKR